ncbi:MAG: VCBS domain-containing protein [Proteobacteria bacterium]|nr:VCBS domain-containing protein [Pseudomonadota bacterium]
MANNAVNVQAGATGRILTLNRPASGAAESVRLAPGETLDLSKIAGESLTLIKLDGRLIVLFPDKAHVVVEGLYLPNGQPAPGIHVNLDGSSTVDVAQFVTQFPISSDEQILTAAGIFVPARVVTGSGGTSSFAFEALPDTGTNGLTQDIDIAGRPFDVRQASNAPQVFAAAAPLTPPTGVNDAAGVVEAGVRAGGETGAAIPVSGVSTANGNVVTNDIHSGGATITGVGAGTGGIDAANVGTDLAGTYGTLRLNADGSFTYLLDNNAPAVNGLAEGAVVTETFTYRLVDSTGLSTTALLTVSVTGTNDAPRLDIDLSAEGSDYRGMIEAEAARSSDAATASAGVSIVRTGAPGILVADPDSDGIASIRVSLAPSSTGENGVLALAPHGVASGVSLAGDGTDFLTLTSTAGGFTSAQAQALIEALRFVNTERTFALDISDRIISITIRDAHGVEANATAYIPVVADVRDTTGLNRFTGTRFGDRIEGMGGADRIDAGAGDDEIVYRAGDGFDSRLDGGSGTDTLTILGDGGDNIFRVNAENGSLIRLSSETAFLNEPYNLRNIEIANLTGGAGIDTLTYAGTSEALTVDLAAGTGTGFNSISGIENITGGRGNDTLSGDAGANIIDGGDGDDMIDGRGGDNTLTGGDGDDQIAAGDGNNLVDAGDGSNQVTLGNGGNTILSGSGDDTITAGDGANTVRAGDGDNSITTGSGDDDILAGIGADIIEAGDGANVIDAGEGDNMINAGDGDDVIKAGKGDDTITAGNGDNSVDACGGTNTITTGSGNDTIVAAGLSDFVSSGDGDDTITLSTTGTAEVNAGAGADTIETGTGDDIIRGGAGSDRITTGDGADTVAFDAVALEGVDSIVDFLSGTDSLLFSRTDVGGGLAGGGLDAGTLDVTRFVSGNAFTDGDQRFLFNTSDNTLYYDADGSGSGSAMIALAHLESGTVTATDIKIA